MREYLVFRTQCGSRILHDHKTRIQSAMLCKKRRQHVGVGAFVCQAHCAAFRDVAELSKRYRKVVKCQCKRLTVKVAAADDIDLVDVSGIDKNKRVVCHGIKFEL